MCITIQNIWPYPALYNCKTLQERTTDDSKESESLKQLLTARMQEFIEEMLIPHFGGMMAFVKDCEGAFDRGNIDILKSYESRLLLSFYHCSRYVRGRLVC